MNYKCKYCYSKFYSKSSAQAHRCSRMPTTVSSINEDSSNFSSDFSSLFSAVPDPAPFGGDGGSFGGGGSSGSWDSGSSDSGSSGGD